MSAEGRVERVVGRVTVDRRLTDHALQRRRPQVGRPRRTDGSYRAALPVFDGERHALTLVLEGAAESRVDDEQLLLTAVHAQLALAAKVGARIALAEETERRSELVLSVSTDFGSQLEPRRVLAKIVERTADLFDADHAAVFALNPDGSVRTEITHNLSPEYTHVIEHATSLPLMKLAFAERRIAWASNVADDPRELDLRPALLREGINTCTVAPLMIDDDRLGILALYHDSEYEWSAADLGLLERLAHQGATVIRNAQNYSRMATWAAQLQSIQQLGARLTRLQSVSDIGNAICTELVDLIEAHNVRVYRLDGDDCVPVAWRGQIGEYEDEDSDQLRLKVGEGITGWVARYGLAQNVPNAVADRRAQTIPGTEDDLDESLLLAPMLYEDEVIGVIVLAMLGLNQFTGDDLRLLEIYATIAAQAMANADATERLREQSQKLSRQVNSQRELLRVTESILGTLDTQVLLEEIAESLNSLLLVDNICVKLHDQATGMLRPIFARGVHAKEFMATVVSDSVGVSADVIRSGEPELITDELNDPRIFHFESTGPLPGALIIAPLRSGEGVQGLLLIERLGFDASFAEEEFELVKLFAAHVSIALRNAATHRAVELRAETDQLTGLWNHGALIQHVEDQIQSRSRFSMLMVDLDFFKRYNDQFGHQAGNRMLQNVARALGAACRDTDWVFRFGGDEFALLLPDTNLAGARVVAEKIQQAVRTLNTVEVAQPVACSVGIAVYPKDGHDGASIILAADRACYAAKRAGRDRIATAAEGLEAAAEFQPTAPTTPDAAEAAYSVA
jgi:diguanylate cyclase (GGDEF)-like protein